MATIGLIYLLKLVLVTALASVLIAYVLEPIVAALVRLHVRRSIGAFLVITAAVVLAIGTFYVSYNRALDFTEELPRYTASLRENLGSVRIENRQTSGSGPLRSRAQDPSEANRRAD